MPDDYAEIDSGALPEGTASEQRVSSELNIIEQLISGVSSTDNYLEAIVRNQRVQLLQSGLRSVFGPTSSDDIPAGVIGTTVDRIKESQTGDVQFEIGGSRRVYSIGADETVQPGEKVVVRSDGLIEPYEGGRVSTLSSNEYEIVETDDQPSVESGGSVTVSPGESKSVIDIVAKGDRVNLLAIGATDAPDVKYRLKVDNERVVGGETNSPLGSVAEPFSFIEIIGGAVPASRRIEYIAEIPSDSTTSADLAGRAHVYNI